MSYTYNPFIGNLDAVPSTEEVEQQVQSFCGFTAVRQSSSYPWLKLARIKMQVPSTSYMEDDYGYFSGLFTVMSQVTKAYNYGFNFAAVQFYLQIGFKHYTNMEAKVIVTNNNVLTPDDIAIVAVDSDDSQLIRSFDLFIRCPYDYARFFFSVNWGSKTANGIQLLTATSEQPIGSIPASNNFVVNKYLYNYREYAVTGVSNTTIVHNMGRYPSVTIVDNNHEMVLADVVYTSKNEIALSFIQSFTGTVILN